MKHFQTNLISRFGLAVFLLMGQACSDEKEAISPIVPDEPKQSIIISADQNTAPVMEQVGGTTTLSFTATADWKANVNAITRAADWSVYSPPKVRQVKRP